MLSKKLSLRAQKQAKSRLWAFLDNHVSDPASIDFFTVPTVTIRILYVFLVLEHERRQITHLNAAEHLRPDGTDGRRSSWWRPFRGLTL